MQLIPLARLLVQRRITVGGLAAGYRFKRFLPAQYPDLYILFYKSLLYTFRHYLLMRQG